MKLRDLDAVFIKYIRPSLYMPSGGHTEVESLKEADGLLFLCPKCVEDDDDIHYVICWFCNRVPDEADPKPVRWNPQGTDLDDLSFTGPGPVSVWVDGCWHGFVLDGTAA